MNLHNNEVGRKVNEVVIVSNVWIAYKANLILELQSSNLKKIS